jgi:urea transporter/murein DD-endopeptidase MepM/ murein hydrolase activator NlpD
MPLLSHLKVIFNSFAELFFLNGYRKGLVIFIASLVNANVTVSGLISVISAYIFARLLRFDKEFLGSGLYTYNALLVGLSIGFLFEFSFLSTFFIITSAILTFILTLALNNIFYFYLKLPVLSIPFVLVSSMAYLSSAKYSSLFVNNLYIHSFLETTDYFPFWIGGFLKCLGAVLFSPCEVVGLVVLLVLLFSSRILFMLSLTGYYTGTIMMALLKGSATEAFSDLNNFNFILISMAIGGVFLVPSVKNYFLSVIAVLVSTMMIDSVNVFWSTFGIPGFTLPFNFISLAFIYTLGLTSYPTMSRYIKSTPEETLDYNLLEIQRYKGYPTALSLPFAGKWTVWQGFDGQWTHQGQWKYAYDFIINVDGKSYKGEGLKLEDYYAYKKPVLSPVRGRIVKVISNLPDNKIGEVDKVNNWGNLLIIQSETGIFIEISHLAQNSLKVKEGDWVEKGALLALCGNSGYSPQPHIHIQVQAAGYIGAYTIPFSFINYLSGSKFNSNYLPLEGETVEPVYTDKNLLLKMNFILDSTFEYEVFNAQDKKIDLLKLTVKMDAESNLYFDSGKGKLYFGINNGNFYFYRAEGEDKYLNLLFIAMPRFPLVSRKSIEWSDNVPLGASATGFKKVAAQFLSSFYPGLSNIRGVYKFKDNNEIEGRIESKLLNFSYKTSVSFHKNTGFEKICINDLSLRRKYEEKVVNFNACLVFNY